ncbi:26278_t:CDS:2, partial [Dentiscutata erythropus]
MDLKYLLILLFLVFFISSVHNQAVYECDYNTTCKCPKLPQGQYCGGQIGCNPNNVYECNPSGGTCEYGYRISCACCGKLTCHPDETITVTVTKHVTDTLSVTVTTSLTTTLTKTEILTVTTPVMTTVTKTETTTKTATKTTTETTTITTTETTTKTTTEKTTVTTTKTATKTTTVTKKVPFVTITIPCHPINDPGSPSFIKMLDSITGILVIIFATMWVCLFHRPSQERDEI